MPEIELSGIVDYLFGWFWELRSTAQGGMGPEPIKYTELLAWQELTSVQLTSWERLTLIAMDSIFLTETGKRNQKNG